MTITGGNCRSRRHTAPVLGNASAITLPSIADIVRHYRDAIDHLDVQTVSNTSTCCTQMAGRPTARRSEPTLAYQYGLQRSELRPRVVRHGVRAAFLRRPHRR